MSDLRPFQQRGVQHLVGHPRAYLADQMGLGKTPQAVVAAAKLDCRRALVVAPLATGCGWVREAQRWAPAGSVIAGLRVVRRKDPIPATGDCAVLVPWTDLAKRLPELLAAERWSVVIADESHKCKGGSRVAQAKAFAGAWKQVGGCWQQERGIAQHAERCWCLSGTPMPNGRPIELLPALTALGIVGGQSAKWRSSKQYKARYCEQRNRWSPSGVDYDGANNLAELRRMLAEDGRFLRREAGDVPGELPVLQRSVVPLSGIRDAIPLDHAQEIIASMHDGSLPAFEDMSEYRAKMGERKAKPAAEWIKSMVEDNGPVVVFVWHQAVGEAIKDALAEVGGAVEFASGDDDPVERQAKVDRFSKSDGPKVLVASIAACGTGMNGMQLRTTTCTFVETPWTPSDADQAEGRIRRMGADERPELALAYYLVADESLDAHITQTIVEKRQRIEQTLGAGERSATATVELPAVPVEPDPEPELPAEVDPTTRPWSWSRDRRTGAWVLRADHAGQPHWSGVAVEVASRDGRKQARILGSRIAGGSDWSLWSHSDPPTSRTQQARRYVQRRGAGRGIDAASDETPLPEARLPEAQAAQAAAIRLTECDHDHARDKNDCGWNQADGLVGRVLAEVPATEYTMGLLHVAISTLRKYRRTQIADLWPIIHPTTQN